MREFRGKTTKKEDENHEFNNVFVYGDLLTNKGVYYIHPQNNVFRVHNELANILIAHEVIPETVGQFTGLTDKNGKKIFEGDIVEFTNKFTHKKGHAEIVFEAFKWKYSGCYYGGNPIVWLCIDDTSVEYEVIGNIHDNLELLEVGE